MTYINNFKRDEIITALQTNQDYLYIERIPYTVICTGDSFYLGVLCERLYLADIKQDVYRLVICKDKSKNTVINYLYSTSKGQFIDNSKSNSLHTLYVVKEIANLILKTHPIMFKVENPKLINIYKSRKGFGDKVESLGNDFYLVRP